jgi:hypothetical protein
MALEYYKPTNDIDPIIAPLVTKFKESRPEFADKNLLPLAYNTPENPLFKVTDAEILLRKKNIRQIINEDQKNLEDERMYLIDRDFVYGMAKNAKGSKRRTLFFTRRGFQIYLMSSKGDISNLFRNFLMVVLDELREKGFVSRDNAIKITEEKYKEDIQKISHRLDHVNLVLEQEQLMRIETEKHLEETEIDRDTLIIISEHHKKKVQLAHEYQENMTEDFPNSKEDELNILKKLHLKPVRVYLVPFEKVQTAIKKPKSRKQKKKHELSAYFSAAKIKELGLESSDDEDEKPADFIIEYDYTMYGILYKPHPDDVMYFTLSPSKKLATRLGIYVHDLRISGKPHYDALIHYLRENCSTPLTGAFLTTLREMEDKLREIFIKQNRNLC